MTAQAEPIEPVAGAPRDLSRLAFSAGIWLTIARWVVRFAHIATVVVLARLLTPVEFGLVALTKVFANMVLIGKFGVQAAVIQQQGEVTDRDLNVAWTYDRLFFNGLLAIGIFLAAPLAASFFESPPMLNIVRALALVPVLQAVENNAFVVLTRELEYRRRFWLEAMPGIAMLVVAMPLAFLWRDAWAFVVAYLAGLAGRALLSYFFYPKVPRPTLHWPTFLKLFEFGRWMIVFKVAATAREQLPALALGKIGGPTALGYYHVGARFSAQLGVDLTQTARKVLFPVYARIQSDTDRVVRGYLRVLELSWVVVGPTAAVVAALAWPAVDTIFGDKWAPAAPLVQLMCVGIVLKISTASINPVLRGRGKPRLEVALTLLWMIIATPLLIVLSIRDGFEGTVLAVVIAEAALTPFWLWVLKAELGVAPRALAARLMAPALLSLATGGAAWIALTLAPDLESWISLCLGLSAAGVVSVLGLFVGARVFGVEPFAVLIQRLASLLSKRRRER